MLIENFAAFNGSFDTRLEGRGRLRNNGFSKIHNNAASNGGAVSLEVRRGFFFLWLVNVLTGLTFNLFFWCNSFMVS